MRKTPKTIMSNSSSPPPAREFAGPPVCSIAHPMLARIAPRPKHVPARIFLILFGIKLDPGKISKNHDIVGAIHRKTELIRILNKINVIIFP